MSARHRRAVRRQAIQRKRRNKRWSARMFGKLADGLGMSVVQLHQSLTSAIASFAADPKVYIRGQASRERIRSALDRLRARLTPRTLPKLQDWP